MSDAITKKEKGILIQIRVTPKSAKEGLAGVEKRSDGKFHIRANIRVVPEKGRANKALEALIAKALGVAKRDVRVARGMKSRYKSVFVSGDPVDLINRARGLQGYSRNNLSRT